MDTSDYSRREVLAAIGAGGGAVVATGGLVGAELSGDGQTAAVAGESTATATSTPTETATESPTSTPTETASPTEVFKPDVSWPSCSSVIVEADYYTSVFLTLADDSILEFKGEHSGANTFEANQPIHDVLIYGDADDPVGASNPAFESCIEVSSTDTPTETATEAQTETATPTATATPRLQTNVDSEFSLRDTGPSISVIDFVVENNHDFSVRVTVRGTWNWSDGKTVEETATNEIGPFDTWEDYLSTDGREDEDVVPKWSGQVTNIEKV